MTIKVEKIVKDHLAAYNSHDVEKMASFWTDDIVLDDNTVGIIRGKQELKSWVGDIFTAVPDVKKELKSFFNTSRQAVCEMVESGTQTGVLGRIPATGKRYSIPIVWIIEMRDDKISRLAAYCNALDFIQQLGLMPKSQTTGK